MFGEVLEGQEVTYLCLSFASFVTVKLIVFIYFVILHGFRSLIQLPKFVGTLTRQALATQGKRKDWKGHWQINGLKVKNRFM